MSTSPNEATPDPGVAAPDPEHEPDDEPRFASEGDDTPEVPMPDQRQEDG